MFGDVKAILRGGAEKKDDGLGKPTPVDNPPEELVIAAGGILAAMGQDFGMGPDSSESRKAEFWDKSRRLAARLLDFFEIADSMPHAEGEHVGGDEEEGDEG